VAGDGQRRYQDCQRLIYALAAPFAAGTIAPLSTIAVQHVGVTRPRRLDWAAALARREPLVFCFTILLHLVPIWSFRYLPTTDGAAHVANADVLRKFHDPALDVFRKYYYISHEPTPNLAGHLILAGLLYVAPPTVAEKILVSLYVVLFPLAVRYAVKAVHCRAAPLAYLSFPLIYSFLFHQGFYNFCLSFAAFFLVIGYWFRNKDRLTGWRALGLCSLALVLYTCHLFSLMMACGVLAALAGWEWGVDVWKTRRPFGPAAKRALVTGAALLPAFVLALVFRPSSKDAPLPDVEPWSFSQLKDELLSLVQFSPMTSFRREEQWLGGAVFALLAALAGWALLSKLRRRYWTGRDVLMVVVIGLAGVFIRAVDPASVYYYVPQRALFYAFLIGILWLAGQPMTRRMRWAVPPIAICIALAFLGSAALKYREFAAQIREFVDVAGGQIAPNRTFLPLVYSVHGLNDSGKPSSTDAAPFYMISGYIAAQRNALDLRNYEARTDHFPVRFRAKLNPYKHLAVGRGLDEIPPKIDIANFRRQGGEIDYVLIWAIPENLKDDPGTVALHEQLKSTGYQRMPLTGAKRTELWKRIGI
jgi:hypothetical protein